jgi:hypothetical protein
MPKREDGQVVETAVEARGAEEHGPTNVSIWALGLVVAALRSGIFPVFQNLTNLTASCWSAVMSRPRLRSRSCFRA